jgi:hypothetical protein
MAGVGASMGGHGELTGEGGEGEGESREGAQLGGSWGGGLALLLCALCCVGAVRTWCT